MCSDLLNIIINPSISKQTCFLCFKQCEQLHEINLDLLIVGGELDLTVTVRKMMADLFPYHETLSQQVCYKCSNAIINIYIIMQKHKLKKQNLMKIAHQLQKEASNIKESDQKCYLSCTVEQTDIINENDSNLNFNQECIKCAMKFESKILLKKHNEAAHKNSNGAVLCPTCGKVFKTPYALKDHLNSHSEKQCPYCSRMLKTYSYYKRHVRNHESAVKKRRQPSYKCNDCSFVSLNKASLEAHINKTHLHIRPHICPICFKGFFKKSNLTDHIRTHEKVKNETCEVCGDHFVCKKSLIWHLRLHNNETPYECNICFKKFVTSGRRHEHVKRKHMEKTECCKLCNKMFSLKRELKRHIKVYHLQKSESKFIENLGT